MISGETQNPVPLQPITLPIENRRIIKNTTRKNIYDAHFSSERMCFVVSDSSGAITVLDVGSGESMSHAPVNQFFSNDHTSCPCGLSQRFELEKSDQ